MSAAIDGGMTLGKGSEDSGPEALQAIADLERKLQQTVGVEAGPFKAWDRVNRAMIRHWCEAMGDENPVYRDPALAGGLGAPDGAVVAPPTMLQAWTMMGYAGEHPPGSDDRDAMPMIPLLDEQGYLAVVATNCEQEYLHPICEGDDISGYSSIESVSARKTTALGVGYFVTQLTEYRNQRDEIVGTMRFRILKYKPH